MADSNLTAERLRELFSYDPDTGLFTRLHAAGTVKAGHIANYIAASGYVVIRINTHRFKAHRLAWLYTYGRWPLDQIDHINGIGSDNRISNLRECNHSENAQNMRLRKTSKSGFLGVNFHKLHGKWQSVICVNQKVMHLGYFQSAELAHDAYVEAKSRLHTFQPTIIATPTNP